MTASFDISAFSKKPKNLIVVLSNLQRVGQWPRDYNRQVEEITCRTPNSALNYCRYVVGAFGVSREAEKVFLDNPAIGIRYLRLVARSHFLEETTQKRFWRKVVKKPELAYAWSVAFGKRLSEDEEQVFVKDVIRAKDYAKSIIKGPFPDKVHRMLMLRSFEQMGGYEKSCLKDYLTFAEACMRSLSEKPAPSGV